MENINGKSRARFLWTFLCAAMGLAVTVSLCLAQGDRDPSQDLQRVQQMQRLLGPCDSLDPKVCFDIYQRRMEQLPERTPDLGWLSRGFGQAMVGKTLYPNSRAVLDNHGWLDPWVNLPSSGKRIR
jgi:hypothetical protein